MKTQQRTFVVERKSDRRRSMMQPASIWGDTDLKALVREAETDAPHLFEPSIVPDIPDQGGVSQPEPTLETQLSDELGTADHKQILAPPVEVEAEQISPSQHDENLTLSAVPEPTEVSSEIRLPRAAKRRRMSTGNRQTDGTLAPTVRPAAIRVEGPADELIALEAENRRLKGLLAQFLRRENLQLQKMLARFGAS